MTATLIGSTCCSTHRQDLAAQRQALREPDVAQDRIYTGHGLAGTNRAIADQLLYDPDDPMGKMFFNILATFAVFEADLIRVRTREDDRKTVPKLYARLIDSLAYAA